MLREAPGVNEVIRFAMRREAKASMSVLSGPKAKAIGPPLRCAFPKSRTPYDQVLAEMRAIKATGTDESKGRLFAYVYTADDDKSRFLDEAAAFFSDEPDWNNPKHEAFQQQVYKLFQHENGLNPTVFPDLRKVPFSLGPSPTFTHTPCICTLQINLAREVHTANSLGRVCVLNTIASVPVPLLRTKG